MKPALFLIPLAAALFAGGCAADRGLMRTPEGLEVVGRVLSVTEIIGMTGDVAEIWQSYRVAPQGREDRPVIVINAGDGCRLTGDVERLYRFRLHRPPGVAFGLKRPGDAEAVSDLFVIACEEVDLPPAPSGEF